MTTSGRTAHAARRSTGIGGSALAQARDLWRDAVAQPLAADRFRISHLAALRATAAMLAGRSDPAGRLAHRPTSAWVLVLKAAPEFSEWASYFAAGVPQRAAADAGVVGAVTDADADEMIEAVRTYLFLIDTSLAAAADRPGTPALAMAVDPAHFPPPGSRVLHARAS